MSTSKSESNKPVDATKPTKAQQGAKFLIEELKKRMQQEGVQQKPKK